MLKRFLPYIIAVATFILLSVIYFAPIYQDMQLSQGDVTQWEGMSKEVVDWDKAHPNDPAYWTDGMFGGMPAIQIYMNYPGNIASAIFHAIGAVFPGPVACLLLMLLGFYVLMLCLEVDPWLSIGGAIAFGFSSFTFVSIAAGHNTKVQTMTMMAPALGGVILAYRKNIWLGGAILALALALAIDADHLQITYYTLLMLAGTGVYYLITSILEKRMLHFAKATGVLVLAAVLAVIPNIASLWSTQEYAKETIRGGTSELSQKKAATKGGGLDFDYATRWSEGSLFYKSYTLLDNRTADVRTFSPGEIDAANVLFDSLNKKSPGTYQLKSKTSLDGEFLTLLIPNLKGGETGGSLDEDSYTYKEMLSKGIPENQAQSYIRQMPLYWGNQPFTSGPVYFGAAIIFLAIFSLMAVRSSVKWALFALSFFSLLLSFGHNTPFFKLMFDLLPVFNKFRTPTMALVIAQLAVPTLALLGLHEVLNGTTSKEDLLKKLYIAAGITGGIILIFGFLGGMFFNFSAPGDQQYISNGNDWLVSALKKDRESLLHTDAFRSLVFVAASFALIWFYIRKTLGRNIFLAAFAVLFLLDGWLVDKRYVNTDNFVDKSKYESSHTPTRADLEIMQDKDPDFRVFNTTRDPFNDAMTSYFHKSVGGYHAAKLIRYQDLIENQISHYNINVLRMLNTKYAIVANKGSKGGEPMVTRVPGLGNAWCVRQIKWVKNADEEMAALTNFSPDTTVIIDERFKKDVPDNAIGADSMPSVKLTDYSPNQLKYSFNSSSNQLVVFSEIYYDHGKGWNAFIDGKPADHFRVNYVLRAMAIPAGTHTIEFKFEPKTVITGNKFAYAGSLLLFLFVFGTFGFTGYKKWKEIEAEPKVEAKPTPPKAGKPSKKK